MFRAVFLAAPMFTILSRVGDRRHFCARSRARLAANEHATCRSGGRLKEGRSSGRRPLVNVGALRAPSAACKRLLADDSRDLRVASSCDVSKARDNKTPTVAIGGRLATCRRPIIVFNRPTAPHESLSSSPRSPPPPPPSISFVSRGDASARIF